MTSTKLRAGVTVAVCVALGAAGGIAGSAAAPKKKQSRQSTTTTPVPPKPPAGRGFGHRFGPGGPGAPVVHAEEVVLNKAGDGYVTETEDNGTVKSVSGQDLAITEGTAKVPYKDVTVTVPAGATVYRNGAKAALGDLKAGDFAHVSQSSEGTVVFVVDPSFRPKFGPGGPGGRDRDHDGHGPDGPGAGAPGVYGPPPANG